MPLVTGCICIHCRTVAYNFRVGVVALLVSILWSSSIISITGIRLAQLNLLLSYFLKSSRVGVARGIFNWPLGAFINFYVFFLLMVCARCSIRRGSQSQLHEFFSRRYSTRCYLGPSLSMSVSCPFLFGWCPMLIVGFVSRTLMLRALRCFVI